MPCVVGLMSGTSLDGVDAALIETDGESVGRRGPALSIAYPPSLRRRLRDLLDRAAGLDPDDAELRDVERALTLAHVDAVRAVLARAGRDADLIGFHGQTILHAPERRLTWQIGDAALLSRCTGLPVVHDFRGDDVGAGGQGAPLAPLYHAALLGRQAGPVAVLNIGGVANLTLVDGDGGVLACDTGPGNALLDDWAERHTGIPCDRDGRLALAGRVDHAVLEALLADPFFRRPPPKSLDRLGFAGALAAVSGLGPEDGAATLAAFTVEAVRRTPLPDMPLAWHVCGGGRHNPALMDGLRRALNVPVEPVDRLGWDGDALEAECFGFLAVRSLRGLPLSCPTTTGVPQPLGGGRLTCSALPTIAPALADALRIAGRLEPRQASGDEAASP